MLSTLRRSPHHHQHLIVKLLLHNTSAPSSNGSISSPHTSSSSLFSSSLTAKPPFRHRYKYFTSATTIARIAAYERQQKRHQHRRPNTETLRWVSILSAICNLRWVTIGALLLLSPSYPNWHMLPLGIVSVVAMVRILYRIGAAKAQQAITSTILGETCKSVVGTEAMIGEGKTGRMLHKKARSKS